MNNVEYEYMNTPPAHLSTWRRRWIHPVWIKFLLTFDCLIIMLNPRMRETENETLHLNAST